MNVFPIGTIAGFILESFLRGLSLAKSFMTVLRTGEEYPPSLSLPI